MSHRGQPFDVAVVGAGPAGATAGYALARRGVHVLILERRKLPREKTCAGGLQRKVVALLPFDIRPLVVNECSGIAFTRRFGDGFVRRADRTLVYQLERASFDEFLARQAVGAGAELRDDFPVAGVEFSPEGCLLRGKRGDGIRCRYVVFADGAGGIGYRTLNRREHRLIQLGIQCRAPFASAAGRYDRSLVSVDWGTVPDAYGWAFPKDDHVVIGCAGPLNRRKLLGAYLDRLVRRLGFDRHDCTRPRAWRMPTLSSAVRLANARAVLVGDAAGWLDPFSGEGISYAIASAKLAADAICRAEAAGGELEAAYRALAGRRLMPEILTQKRLKRCSALVPGHVHRLFRRNDRVWESFSDVLCGTREPEALGRLAPFSPLWPVIDAAAALASRYRQRSAPGPTAGQLDRMLARASAQPHPAVS